MNDFTGIELAFSARLVVAAVLGMAIGIERSIVGKHAGMRTYAMVSLGSALFVVLGTLAAYQLSVFSGVNPLQIAGSIVVGIGFIGSGLAVYQGDRLEITTASGIWVVAAVGMACGFGLYWLAVITTIISIVIFSFFSKLERKIRGRWGVEQK
ncbi:MAG TPA: MgtC/SapB family protein [Candidatus Paceibacterota bacterium]|nr:MgtC/SapB family protein [Candidatus Paceibacterota bacterium]